MSYRIEQLFSEDEFGEFTSFDIVDIHGRKISKSKLSEENLSLSFEYSNDGINFVSW